MIRKIRPRLLKSYNSLLIILLTLLGFSTACEQGADQYGSPVPEYGVPHAMFIVKGTVQSELNSSAIPNIEIIMGYDTVYSDPSGNYQVENSSFPDNPSFLVKFKDIDGPVNGDYNSLDTIVEFKNPEFTGGIGTWDLGKTEKELNVKLDPKK